MSKPITNDVLAEKMDNLGMQVQDLRKQMDGYPSHDVIELRFAEVSRDIKAMDLRIVQAFTAIEQLKVENSKRFDRIENTRNFSKWIGYILLTASLLLNLFAIFEYLTKVRGM